MTIFLQDIISVGKCFPLFNTFVWYLEVAHRPWQILRVVFKLLIKKRIRLYKTLHEYNLPRCVFQSHASYNFPTFNPVTHESHGKFHIRFRWFSLLSTMKDWTLLHLYHLDLCIQETKALIWMLKTITDVSQSERYSSFCYAALD